jgi:hypothetical protein
MSPTERTAVDAVGPIYLEKATGEWVAANSCVFKQVEKHEPEWAPIKAGRYSAAA